MEIQDWRKKLGLSQRAFAAYFEIPLGTVRNWEQGISTPPEYVFNMIKRIIRRDNMINSETIRLLGKINVLQEKLKKGIIEFENATEQDKGKIIYHKEEEGMNRYRIVADACIIDDPECYHHDIISYYGCDEDEYTVRCVIEEEEYWVEIHLLGSDIFVVIDPDIWYVC